MDSPQSRLDKQVERLYNLFIEDKDTRTCRCVTKHVPLYSSVVNILDDIYVCPSTYFNVIALLKEYKKAGGTPAGSTTKHYSSFVQDIAEALYEGA